MTKYPGIYTGEDIWINDLPLNSIDENGCQWVVSDIEGWWGLPDPEVPEDKRPFSEDGNYYVVGRYGARNITMTGHIIPTVENTLNVPFTVAARDLLNRTLNMVRQTGVLRVDEPTGSKIAAVQIVSRPVTRFTKANDVLQFSVDMRAADPRKYSRDETLVNISLPTSTSGRTYNKTFNYTYGSSSALGMQSVVNVGSYATYGVFTITGPVINPAIEHIESGAILHFNLTLEEGQTLVVDLRNKTIKLNNEASRRSALLNTSRWFKLEPGINTIRYSGVQSPPTPVSVLYLAYRSAWIE